MAVLLLALWVPVTSHCLIEVAGLLPGFLCCADACGTADEDACQSLESASYKADDPAPLVAAPAFAVLFLALAQPAEVANLADGEVASLHLAQPELPVTWQFSFRTALPPRAPSFVS